MKLTWVIVAILIALALLAWGTLILLEDSSFREDAQGGSLAGAGPGTSARGAAGAPGSGGERPGEQSIKTREFGKKPEPQPVDPPGPGAVDFKELLRRATPKPGYLTARLIGTDQEPVANGPEAFQVWVVTGLEARFVDQSGNLVGWRNRNEIIRVRTDGEGRIRFPVPSGLEGEWCLFCERPWRSWLYASPHSKPMPPPLAKGAYAALAAEAERDLGDVHLVDGPLLVSGRVLDAFGIARGGVMVRVYVMPVQPWEPDRRDWQRARRHDKRRTPSLDDLAVNHFGVDGTLLVTVPTDRDGGFEIRDTVASSVRYAIAAGLRSRGQMAYPRLFETGRSGLTIDLRESGGLRGSVRMPAMDTVTRPRVAWRFSGPLERLRLWQKIKAKDDGSFDTPRLAPGLYDLRVSMFGTEERIFTGLRVRPGEVTEPRAIQQLELAKGLEVAEVFAGNRRGQGVAQVQITLTSRGRRKHGSTASRQTSGVTDGDGLVRFLVERDAEYYMEARAAGYHPFRGRATFPMQITMKGSATLVVTCDPPLPTPGDDGDWHVVMVPVDIQTLRAAKGMAVNRTGDLRAYQLDPGSYRLHACYRRKNTPRVTPHVLLGIVELPATDSAWKTTLKTPQESLLAHVAGAR